VTRLRTTIGIVEWAARASGARAVELRVADRLGACVDLVRDGRGKAILARVARHHGYHSELWDGIVPVLHDAPPPSAPDPKSPLGAVAAAVAASEAATDDERTRLVGDTLPALVAVYREWEAAASPLADAPALRVLRLVLADDERDQADLQGIFPT
jgi:hypothetical protein